MDSDKLKCVLCQKFPEGEIYQCNDGHNACTACVEELNVRICTCCEDFDRKRPNPIDELIKQSKVQCPYDKFGCSWTFKPNEIHRHQEECKFRPYKCISIKLGVNFGCNWKGLQKDIEEHLKNDHSILGKPFNYHQFSNIPFIEDKSLCSIKLVDAFSKHFLFYHSSNVSTKMIYFFIIYFGRRQEANQYFYELDIQSQKEDEIRRVKFNEKCVADCEDFKELMAAEKCPAISFNTAKNYVHNGHVHFRFILKKIDKELESGGRERKNSGCITDKPISKPKPTPFKFPEKGKTTQNVKRTGSNTNSSGNGSGGQPNNKPAAKPSEDPPLQQTSVSNKAPKPDDVSAPLDYSSSINKFGVSGQDSPLLHQEPCPLMSPSINRHNARDLQTSYCTLKSTEYRQLVGESLRAANQPPPGECKTTATLCQRYTQPYKMKDDRLYLQRHPSDCLGKPVLKR